MGHDRFIVYYNPSYHWGPKYETDKGTAYDVDGVHLAECPVSYISPKMAEVVASLESARRVREFTGESPLPHVSTWPVTLLDASRLIANEYIGERNARFEAEQQERE